MVVKNDVLKQVEEAIAPAKALSELALSNTERLVDLQVESLRKYSTVVIESCKAALAVKDLDGAQKYVAKQGEVAKEVVESMVNDAKVVVELGRDYASEVQKVVSGSISKATKKAA